MANEERFRRLLWWYPLAWRDRNSDVVLGVMLDDAEQAGRELPTVGERLSAVVYGLGTRLGRRFAVVAVILALATAAVAGVLTMWGATALSSAGIAWILPALTVFVGPTLVSAAAIALARERGLLTEPRAVLTALVAFVALVAVALTQVSWGLGFDAADKGTPTTGIVAAWPWLFVGAWAIGATAIALLIDALLRRGRIHPGVAVALSAVAGVLLAPAVGISLISPYTGAVAAAVTAVFVAFSNRAPSTPAPERPVRTPHVLRRGVPARTRAVARLLAILCALVTGFGVVYAFTGSGWGAAGDQTHAMAQGITLALIGGLPLVAAIGVTSADRGRSRPLHTWGPLILVVPALAAVAVAYQGAPTWERMAPGFAVGSIFGGTVIAWWIAPRLPGNTRVRVAIAALIGIVYAAFLGVLLAPTLAFVLPLLAAAFAIWTPGRPSRHQASNPAVAQQHSHPSLPRLS